jgi:hypothetical protein
MNELRCSADAFVSKQLVKGIDEWDWGVEVD